MRAMQPTTTTSTTGGAEPPATLDPDDVFRFGLLLGGLLLSVGVLIVIWRLLARDKAAPSVARSWIAIGLVVGLLMFCVFSFQLDDADVRSTLIGAVTASVGAAIAFYFSTKSGEQARKDFLEAQRTLLGTPPSAPSGS
jgi:hypothetical protein